MIGKNFIYVHGVLSDNNYVGHKVFELRPFKDACTDANIEIHSQSGGVMPTV